MRFFRSEEEKQEEDGEKQRIWLQVEKNSKFLTSPERSIRFIEFISFTSTAADPAPGSRNTK